ncbi:MAG: AsmA family protein, partial [Gammaproteobacteria bacterium]
MKKILKIALSLAGILVVVVIIALVTLANIDPNNHKERIIAEVRDRTGQSLRLDGDIQLTLYPWLGITVDNVVLENPQSFGESAMVSIEHAAFRARLLPLLNRNFEIDTVVLRGVDARLQTNADGRSNWEGFSASTETTVTAPAGSSGLPFNDLRVGGVSIERVNLVYDDLSSGRQVSISDFRFTTDELVYGEPINVDLGLTLAANNPALDADITLSAVVNYDLDNGRYGIEPLQLVSELRGANVPGGRASITLDSVLHFDLDEDSLTIDPISLNAPGTALSASVVATGLQSTAPRLETRIDLQGDDLAMLFQMAGIEPLATQLRELNDRSFTLQSQVAAQPARGGVTVSNLQLNLLGAAVSGNVQAENLNSDAALLRGELVAAGPNLPSVLEVIGQVTGGSESKLALGGRGLQQVSDKAFNIDAQFNADLQRGSVEIPRLDVRVLGATVQGNLTAAALTSDTPNVQGSLQGNGPDLPQLLQIGGWFYDGEQSPIFVYGTQLGVLQNKSFTLNSQFSADLRSGAINVPTLDARALGLQLNGHFDAANINNSNGNVTGALTLSGSNLRNLLNAVAQPGLAEVAQSLNVNLEFGGTSNNLAINPARVELVLAGNRIPNSPVTVALNAASRINVERETLAVEQFTLSGLGLDTRGNINATNIFSAPDLSGNVELAQFNLRRLLQQLNQPVPDTSDSTVLQAVTLKTGFNASSSRVSLSNLEMQLDETALRGNFSLNTTANNAGNTQEWQLDLDIDEINVDRYLAEPQSAATQNSDDAAFPI